MHGIRVQVIQRHLEHEMAYTRLGLHAQRAEACLGEPSLYRAAPFGQRYAQCRAVCRAVA